MEFKFLLNDIRIIDSKVYNSFIKFLISFETKQGCFDQFAVFKISIAFT